MPQLLAVGLDLVFVVPRRNLDVPGPIPVFLGLGLCWEALFFYPKVFIRFS